jgi:shikimate dehydrogenase
VTGIAGDDTDAAAVGHSAAELLAGGVVRRALVVGTGGSARSAATGVVDRWPGTTVEVRSRDAARARDFLEWAARVGLHAEAEGSSPLDLVVHATPLGLSSADPLPLDPAAVRERGAPAVLDLVYVRGRTRVVQAARRAGLRAEDGRTVLVAQGAESFRLFCGVPAPVEVMRAAVEDALGG